MIDYDVDKNTSESFIGSYVKMSTDDTSIRTQNPYKLTLKHYKDHTRNSTEAGDIVDSSTSLTTETADSTDSRLATETNTRANEQKAGAVTPIAAGVGVSMIVLLGLTLLAAIMLER